MRVLKFSLAVLLWYSSHRFGGAQEHRHRVQMALSDCWGQPITGSIIASSIEAISTYQRLSYPKEVELELPSGQFHFLFEAQGYFTAAILESITRDRRIVACLTLAPISGSERPWVQLRGLVANSMLSGNREISVTIESRYSSFKSTLRVNSDRQFRFNKLQPGRYTLEVQRDDGSSLAKKEIDVRPPVVEVQFP